MRNVWVMNLKDNRGNGENKNFDEKFRFCYEHNILAIGWANSEYDKNDLGLKKAKNALCKMQRGDIVWVRNPYTGERYLCEVLNDRILSFPYSFHAFDAAYGRICEYHLVKQEQYEAITDFSAQLVSFSTVRSVTKESVIKETNELFESTCRYEKDLTLLTER